MWGSPKFTLQRKTGVAVRAGRRSSTQRTPAEREVPSRRAGRPAPAPRRGRSGGAPPAGAEAGRPAAAPRRRPRGPRRRREERAPRHAGCSTSTRYPSGSRTKKRCPPHGGEKGGASIRRRAAASSLVDRQAVGDLEHQHGASATAGSAGATIVTPGPVLGRVALLGERQAHPRRGRGSRRAGRRSSASSAKPSRSR